VDGGAVKGTAYLAINISLLFWLSGLIAVTVEHECGAGSRGLLENDGGLSSFLEVDRLDGSAECLQIRGGISAFVPQFSSPLSRSRQLAPSHEAHHELVKGFLGGGCAQI